MMGGLLASCAAIPEPPARQAVGQVERVDAATSRITLTDQTVKRIGIQTAVVRAAAEGSVVPYSALIYDTNGATFVYTSPAPLVFVRQAVRVGSISGDQLVLSAGPETGTTVVTVGASQLLGLELGIGS